MAIGAAALALSLGAGTAAGIPISDVRTTIRPTVVQMEATISSPPIADCRADARAALLRREGGSWRTIRALGRHAVNVCLESGAGWTTAPILVRFERMNLLRPGRYAICARAWQRVGRRVSAHARCVRFAHRGPRGRDR